MKDMNSQITTINPASDDVLENYPLMDSQEASAAIEACQKAFLEWRLCSLDDRAKVIRAIADGLKKHKEELAQLMTREVGKLITVSRQEVDLCVAICDYTAEHGPQDLADEERPIDGGTGVITYQPLGIIYGIQPWNFPAYQVVRYTMANLMAGNGILLKHASSCTGSGLLLRDIFEEAGLPKNLFTVLVIDHATSNEVVKNKYVRGVTLTGSEPAGRKVAALAAENLKKTVLELGSNDAHLVLDDADLDVSVGGCMAGRLYNNGQTCVNAKRFVVTKKNYDAFVARIVENMKAIKLGDPTDDKTALGPMSRTELRDELHKQVTDSVKKGARILCGGEVPDHNGAWYPATVLADVKPGQPAYDDELFGPVASIIMAEDDEDAMRIANDSRYGLGGGIYSTNVERARELASTYFDTGMVSINGYTVALPNMPFGGVKDSGYGREHGGFGMKEFVNAKSLYIKS